MWNDIYLLRDDVYRQVLREQSPEMVPEAVGAMGAVPVVPYSPMGTHDDHAVDESCNEHPYAEELKKKEEEKWNEADDLQPAEKWKPVFSVFENV